jgi:hypothetical protein
LRILKSRQKGAIRMPKRAVHGKKQSTRFKGAVK